MPTNQHTDDIINQNFTLEQYAGFSGYDLDPEFVQEVQEIPEMSPEEMDCLKKWPIIKQIPCHNRQGIRGKANKFVSIHALQRQYSYRRERNKL